MVAYPKDVVTHCTNCAALRGEVDRLRERYQLEQTRYEGISSANEELRATLSRYREAVEWAAELDIMKRYDIEYGWSASDELRKRAGIP